MLSFMLVGAIPSLDVKWYMLARQSESHRLAPVCYCQAPCNYTHLHQLYPGAADSKNHCGMWTNIDSQAAKYGA